MAYYRSYNQIMEDALKRIDGYMSVNEGDTAWILTSPIALELERFYGNLDEILNKTNILNAYNNGYLDEVIQFAEADGVFRKPAALATGKVTFYGKKNAKIKDGTKVYQEDDTGLGYITVGDLTLETLYREEVRDPTTNRITTEALYSGEIDAVAEDFGYKYNCDAHKVNFFTTLYSGIDHIDNLVPFEGGADEEDIDSLFARHRLKVSKNPNGANCAQYEQWCLENEMIGYARIFPCQRPLLSDDGVYSDLVPAHGHVTCVLIDQHGNAPTETTCKEIKNYIDPNNGMGTGVAPINAFVHVIPAQMVPIEIKMKYVLKEGYDHEEVFEACKENIRFAIEEALKNVKIDYQTTTKSVTDGTVVVEPIVNGRVKIHDLCEAIYHTDGIENYIDVTANGRHLDIKFNQVQAPQLKFEIENFTQIDEVESI